MANKLTSQPIPAAPVGCETSLATTLKEVLRCHDVEMETAIPAQVVSYDRDNHRATVQILVQQGYNTVDGTQYLDRPQITVPVLSQQSGMMLVDVPLYPGDTGFVVAGHRDGASAVDKNSGITEAPSQKSSASSGSNGGSGSGGGSGGNVSAEDFSASVTLADFAASVVGGSSGTYVFLYDGGNWLLGRTTACDISDFGIKVLGTPYNGATITVTYVMPIGGAGGSAEVSVRQGSGAGSSGGGGSGSSSGGSGSSSSGLTGGNTNGEKMSRTLAGTNANIRSILGSNGSIRSIGGADMDRRIAKDIRSLVGTNGDIKSISGTAKIAAKIRQVVDKVVSAVKKGDKEKSQSSSAAQTATDAESKTTANNQVTENTENKGSQPPDTFLMHRYEYGFFVPSRFGGFKLDAEDKMNLVIANTRRVEDGTDEDGKPKYRQEVFGKFTISRDGKTVMDAPAGYEVRADVDVMGQMVVDGEFTAVKDAVFASNVGVAGGMAVEGELEVGDRFSVKGESKMEERVTVGKSFRKAIIDPHQDLRDGAAYDTAKFREVEILTGIQSRAGGKTVFKKLKVLALTTEGEKTVEAVYDDSAIADLIDVKAGDNITVDKTKSGRKTIYTINGQEGGGGGGSVAVDDISIGRHSQKLEIKHWNDAENKITTPLPDLNDVSYEAVVRYGGPEGELKYVPVYNHWHGVFWWDATTRKLKNCRVLVARKVISCADYTMVGEGTMYAKISHPTSSADATLEIVTTSGTTTDEATYLQIISVDANGKITADYRGIPTIQLYE